MMNDIVKLAQNLRKEHLFVNEQKQRIKVLNEKISSTCDRIFHASWILKQQRLSLYDHIYSRNEPSLTTSTCDKANLVEQASFVDANKVLNNDSNITELLSYIRNNPDLVAQCLMISDKTPALTAHLHQHQELANDQPTCEQITQILISSVYGNAILHEDYMFTLRLLGNLIDKQLVTSDDPRRLLRQKSSAFSAVFKTFTESLLEAKLFLNSTLNDSILHVLGEDELMLEIDPNKAAIRFANQERNRHAPHDSNQESRSSFASSNSSSTNAANNNHQANSSASSTSSKMPEFTSNTKLYKTYVTNRLVSFTAKFIEGIRDNIHCLPPSLLWIIKYVYQKLSNISRLTDRQVRTVCSDLLFSSFICPAILYPDYYGLTDAYISPNGRFNLAQVAQIIQWLAVTNYEKIEEEPLINIDGPSESSSNATSKPITPSSTTTNIPSINPSIAPRLNDIYSKFPPDCISSILDYVLNSSCDIDEAVDSVSNCKDVSRTCFLITELELFFVTSFFETAVSKLEFEYMDLKDNLQDIIKNAKSSFKNPEEFIRSMRCIKSTSPSTTSSQSSGIYGSSSTVNSVTSIVHNNILANSNGCANGSPRSRRSGNVLKRVARKGFRSSSSSSDLNSNYKSADMQCKCLACAGYKVILIPFINRNSTNYITTSLPEEETTNQAAIIENSEVASVNSVASSSLELQNENDNLSDMVSAHVSSGRATPNVSGRNTPSQGGSSDNEDPGELVQGPLVDFSNDLPDVVPKENPVQIANNPVAGDQPVQNADIEIEDRFCKFDVRHDFGLDETKSLLSDTWSTDVMASDCDFFPNYDSDYSARLVHRLGLLNFRADDPNEPILRSRWPMMEPLISFADATTISDIKKKLRLVFGTVDLLYIPQPEKLNAESPSDNENELVKYLRVLLSNASRLGSDDSVTIREAIRCVKPFSNSACQELLRSFLDDYDRRSTYINELIEFYQRLLIVLSRIDNVLNHIERDKLICNHNLVTIFVGHYMEQKERNVQLLIRKFNTINAADEKTSLIEKFLAMLYNALESDNNWQKATPEQIEHARRIIERHVMTQIYWSAFYPNGEIDVHRDKLFNEHLKKLSKIITVDHKDIRVPKMYHSEYPWPSAQADLEVINSCKAARDKVTCVVKCCKTIMKLLSIADEKHNPSADDLMPVLVFVIIQANPNSLLSTVQYVNSFYEKHFQGEQAYWWTQFCSAIEFIKTMDYWENQ